LFAGLFFSSYYRLARSNEGLSEDCCSIIIASFRQAVSYKTVNCLSFCPLNGPILRLSWQRHVLGDYPMGWLGFKAKPVLGTAALYKTFDFYIFRWAAL